MKEYNGKFKSKNYGPLVNGKVLLAGPDEFSAIKSSNELTFVLDNTGLYRRGKMVTIKATQKNGTWSTDDYPDQRVTIRIVSETDTELVGTYSATSPSDTGKFKVYKSRVINKPSSRACVIS